MTDERKAMFEDWKNKNKDNIEGVVITLLSYEKGVDTKTCYDEVDWIIRKAFLAGLKAGSQLDKVWHDCDAGEDCYEDSHEGKWVKREDNKPK